MKSVNIDALSEEELVELNHKIVARLRFLSQMRSHSEMLDFRIGEKVKFHPSGHPELIGTLPATTRRPSRSLPRPANTGMLLRGCSPSWIPMWRATPQFPMRRSSSFPVASAKNRIKFKERWRDKLASTNRYFVCELCCRSSCESAATTSRAKRRGLSLARRR